MTDKTISVEKETIVYIPSNWIRYKDWWFVVLREIDFLLKLMIDSLLISPVEWSYFYIPCFLFIKLYCILFQTPPLKPCHWASLTLDSCLFNFSLNKSYTISELSNGACVNNKSTASRCLSYELITATLQSRSCLYVNVCVMFLEWFFADAV